MPIGEIAGELLGGIFKLIGRFFTEFIFEMVIKGSGYFICRSFSKQVDPDGILVVLVGLTFLGIVSVGFFIAYDFIQLQLIINHCSEAGGEFDYQSETCQIIESASRTN